MTPHISTEEAKKLKVGGFDTYIYSHLLYKDDLNRDYGVVRLNMEALKAFSDSVTISQRHLIKIEQAETAKWLEQGGFLKKAPLPQTPLTITMMNYANYEHLKIASGFELHLKARLLARNYVVHEIDTQDDKYKLLGKEQKGRPIEKEELFATSSYYFDGSQNYLPGLKQSSIKFSWLTNILKYRASLDLTEQQLDIIEDYRNLRNQIHFPGDILQTPSINALGYPVTKFLLDFINFEIIDWSNKLIAKHNLNFQNLVKID